MVVKEIPAPENNQELIQLKKKAEELEEMLVELIKNKCLITDEYKDGIIDNLIITKLRLQKENLEVEKYKLTKEKERIEKDYKNLENNIAEVVSKYYEPTDEEIKINKDNWKEEFINQLRNEERNNKIIKTIEIIENWKQKTKEARLDAETHLEALEVAQEWRERQLAEKLEQLETVKNQEISWQAQAIQQLKQELHLANKSLPALPRKKNKLLQFTKKISEKIHLKKKQGQIIEVKPKQVKPTHTNSFLPNLFLISLIFKR